MQTACKDLVPVHQTLCWHLYVLLFGLLWLFACWPLSQAALFWLLHILPWTHIRWSAREQCPLPFSTHLERLGCWDGAQSSSTWSRSAPIISASVFIVCCERSGTKRCRWSIKNTVNAVCEPLTDLWIRIVLALEALHEILTFWNKHKVFILFDTEYLILLQKHSTPHLLTFGLFMLLRVCK